MLGVHHRATQPLAAISLVYRMWLILDIRFIHWRLQYRGGVDEMVLRCIWNSGDIPGKNAGYRCLYAAWLKCHDVPTSSERLLVLPYFMDERKPIWNSNARGTIVDLSLFHKKEHLYRAFMEEWPMRFDIIWRWWPKLRWNSIMP